jgi:hypothetical protein
MFRSKGTKQTGGRASEYASCKDFQRIFNEDMVGLHRLAFLLTVDEARAEQCFVTGLEDSIHGNPVFRQWARAWSNAPSFRTQSKPWRRFRPDTGVRRKKLLPVLRMEALPRTLRPSWLDGSLLTDLSL